MRAILGLFAGMIAYVVSVLLIFLFFYWFFDKPMEWSYFIPIVTALLSISIASVSAEEVSESKKVGALLTVLIAGMWIIFVVIDVVGDVSDIFHAIIGQYKSDEIGAFEIFMFSFDKILSSKIFAVISFLVAGGSVEEFRKA